MEYPSNITDFFENGKDEDFAMWAFGCLQPGSSIKMIQCWENLHPEHPMRDADSIFICLCKMNYIYRKEILEKMEKEKCDMCGSKIQDNKCDCGIWKDADEIKDNPMLKSIEYFHEMKTFTVTGDSPHLGCAVVFFKGDYNDCKKVEKFIYEMKGRPYYDSTT